jgi:hypothetical protein
MSARQKSGDSKKPCSKITLCSQLARALLAATIFIVMPFAFVFGWFCTTLFYLKQANTLQTLALLCVMPNQVALIKIVR